ncbi:hypothetical protein JCM18899A_36440 [Nocardioides sp. AN3]
MADLVELGRDESWDLVPQQPICRVAWSTGNGPFVLPVNHVVHGRSIWIRTAAYSSLVREVDDTRVAVLVDSIDTSTRLGWSVQLRGVAHVHWHAEEVPTEVRTLHTWASGPRPLWIHLTPDEIHGRRLVAGD